MEGLDWGAIIQFLITSGIAAAVLAGLIKFGTGAVGKQLGWDEKKQTAWKERLDGWAATGIHYAEEAAKHKVFSSKDAQARFKEGLAVDFVSRQMGIEEGLAKAAVRAAFSLSPLAKPVKHDEAAKFEDKDAEALIEEQGG